MCRPARWLFPPLLVVLSVVLAACGDRATEPTQPGTRAELLAPTAPGLYCNSNLASTIGGEINTAFKNNVAVGKTASTLFAEVKKACNTPSDVATVRAKAMIYLKYFTQHIADVSKSILPSPEQFDVTHVNHVFEYAGWPDPNLVPKAFSSQGAVTVCGSEPPFVPLDANGKNVLADATLQVECYLAPAERRAALIVGAGAIPDQNDRLVALAPVANAQCIPNQGILRYTPPCYEYTAAPATIFVAPYVKVAMCPSESLGAVQSGRSQLLHPAGTADVSHSGTHLAPQFEGQFFSNTYALCDNQSSTAMLWPGTSNGALAWLDRVATRAVGLLSPRPAYAYDRPIVGSSSTFSPWSAVDPAIFYDDFENFTTGASRLGTLPRWVHLDRGSWTDTTEAPGTITIQNNFADIPGQSVVLSQGGGNCSNCGALKLIGTVADSVAATQDYWELSWISVQTKPSVKAAPFVIRGLGNDTVGVLSYKTDPSGDHLYYNNQLVYSWTTGVSQRFEILVDLVHQMAQLCIYGRTASGFTLQYPAPTVSSSCRSDPGSIAPAYPGLTQNVAAGSFTFVSTGHRVALYQFNAEYSGIDAGIMAIDNVVIRRAADPIP